MTKETLINNTLVFEGLMCAGKTTLVKLTCDTCGYTPIIKSIPRDLSNPIPIIFMNNDEAKFAEARTVRGIGLMDRGYLATVVFYTVMGEVKAGFSAETVLSWVKTSMDKTLYKPTAYLYIDIPPEVSLARARIVGRPSDERNLWILYPNRMQYWYERYLESMEKDVPLHRVDGTRPFDLVKDDVAKLISSNFKIIV